MRKISFIVIGLLLLAAATGAYIYRVNDHPFTATTDETSATRSLEVAPESPPQGEGLEGLMRQRYFQPQLGGWQVFSMVMDVLNLLVGGVGIVLTISGIRMRRASLTQNM